MGCIVLWDAEDCYYWGDALRMKPLHELLDAIRAGGRTAEHDWRDDAWVLVVDGEVVARGHSQGEMIDAGWRWWRAAKS